MSRIKQIASAIDLVQMIIGPQWHKITASRSWDRNTTIWRFQDKNTNKKFFYSKRIWHPGERTRRNIVSFIINRKLNPKSRVVSDNLLNCNCEPLYNDFCGLRAKTFLLEQQNCANTERQTISNPFMYNVVKWSNILKNYRKILEVCLAILQHYAWEG